MADVLPSCDCKEPQHVFTTFSQNDGETKVRDDYKVAFTRTSCTASGMEHTAECFVWGKPRGREDPLNRRPRLRVRVFGRSKDECHAAAVEIMRRLEDRFAHE